MNKKLLIISPYFPPVNAADMQRVRMSLPYFAANGWDAEVVMVDESYADLNKDELLLQSIPGGIKIHKVKALKKTWTTKLGLGSIALRSLWFYKQAVSQLLQRQKYDLIYFSTTQFPVCILGAYWKRKFGIPYIIDMQDPWHSEYYQDKPKLQRPKKYWFSYRLNKYLEPIALKSVDGLISVSENYIIDLKKRYPVLANVPSATITFGAFEPDMQIANDNEGNFPCLLDQGSTNIVYVGRGGADMHKSISPLFQTIKDRLETFDPTDKPLKFYFIGTSYAPAGEGEATVLPLAKSYGIQSQVVELTDRISYYHTLATLQQADALFIPGSDDPAYTASKIYPYLLTQKPLLGIFNAASSAINILKEFGVKHVYAYEYVTQQNINNFFLDLNDPKPQTYNSEAADKYSAQQMTFNQCQLFNLVLNNDQIK